MEHFHNVAILPPTTDLLGLLHSAAEVGGLHAERAGFRPGKIDLRLRRTGNLTAETTVSGQAIRIGFDEQLVRAIANLSGDLLRLASSRGNVADQSVSADYCERLVSEILVGCTYQGWMGQPLDPVELLVAGWPNPQTRLPLLFQGETPRTFLREDVQFMMAFLVDKASDLLHRQFVFIMLHELAHVALDHLDSQALHGEAHEFNADHLALDWYVSGPSCSEAVPCFPALYTLLLVGLFEDFGALVERCSRKSTLEVTSLHTESRGGLTHPSARRRIHRMADRIHEVDQTSIRVASHIDSRVALIKKALVQGQISQYWLRRASRLLGTPRSAAFFFKEVAREHGSVAAGVVGEKSQPNYGFDSADFARAPLLDEVIEHETFFRPMITP